MTQPPAPPVTVGLAPSSAFDVNNMIGSHLRTFTDIKTSVGQDHAWLLSSDLKVEPYLFSADQETLIKSAIANLDVALDAVDMTFITRLTGLF